VFLGPSFSQINLSNPQISRGTTFSNTTNNFITNREYLMDLILNQLNINIDDLNKDPGFIKSKVREHKLNSILEDE